MKSPGVFLLLKKNKDNIVNIKMLTIFIGPYQEFL